MPIRVRIREPEDCLSGLLFLFLGVGAAIIALNYPIGTAARMGAGYLPIMLGGLLALLGAIITLKSLDFSAAADDAPASSGFGAELRRVMRPLVFVVAALLTFVYLLPRYGLVAAVIPLVLISALADHRPRLLMALPLSIGLAVLAVLIFVHGLGLPIRVWP